MAQRPTEQRYAGGEPEDRHPQFPRDAERFAVGLEDDRELHRAWLIAGVLSEVALVGMLITSLQEPGLDATIVLVLLVVGLGLAMGAHVARFRINGQPRTHAGKRHASRTLRRAGSPGLQPAGSEDGRRRGRPTLAESPPWHKTARPAAGNGDR
jgi:hypothetical protein